MAAFALKEPEGLAQAVMQEREGEERRACVKEEVRTRCEGALEGACLVAGEVSCTG